MAAPAVLAGLGAAAGALGGLFSKQSHSPAALVQTTQRTDTSTAAIAGAKDARAARILLRNAREERMYSLLTDPQLLGTLVTLGGLAVSCRLPFHDNPQINPRIQGIAAASCVLMGLGRAGVGDMTTLTMAGITGATVGAAPEISGAGQILGREIIPGTGVPLYALVGGPVGQLAWSISRLSAGT